MFKLMNLLFYLWIILHLISGILLAYLVKPLIIHLLKTSGKVVTNYRGREVINMSGLIIPVVWVILIALALILSSLVDTIGIYVPPGFIIGTEIALPLTLMMFSSSFFGFIDDTLGSREFSGFKGHIGALLSGKLTTGALKALGIPFVAVISSAIISNGLFELIINVVLISLMVNMLNLLDLRPGRALKTYLILQLIIAFMGSSAMITSSAALIGIAIVLLWPDLKEQTMLGDTGSNVLGAILGFCLAIGFDLSVKLAIIALLIIIQILTEKYSLSSVIEKVSVLRFFDNLGRNTD